MSDLVDRIRSEAAISDRPGQMIRLESIADKVEALEAKLARVEALAEEWESWRTVGSGGPRFARYLRAALGTPETTDPGQERLARALDDMEEDR